VIASDARSSGLRLPDVSGANLFTAANSAAKHIGKRRTSAGWSTRAADHGRGRLITWRGHTGKAQPLSTRNARPEGAAGGPEIATSRSCRARGGRVVRPRPRKAVNPNLPDRRRRDPGRDSWRIPSRAPRAAPFQLHEENVANACVCDTAARHAPRTKIAAQLFSVSHTVIRRESAGADGTTSTCIGRGGTPSMGRAGTPTGAGGRDIPMAGPGFQPGKFFRACTVASRSSKSKICMIGGIDRLLPKSPNVLGRIEDSRARPQFDSAS